MADNDISIEDYGYDEPLYETSSSSEHLVVYECSDNTGFTLFEVDFSNVNPDLIELDTYKYVEDAIDACIAICKEKDQPANYVGLNRSR